MINYKSFNNLLRRLLIWNLDSVAKLLDFFILVCLSLLCGNPDYFSKFNLVLDLLYYLDIFICFDGNSGMEAFKLLFTCCLDILDGSGNSDNDSIRCSNDFSWL